MIGFSVRIPTSREAAKMMESSKPSISLLLAVNLKKLVDANKSFPSIQAKLKNVKRTLNVKFKSCVIRDKDGKRFLF